MEVERATVNGTHEPDETTTDEKILKLKKSVLDGEAAGTSTLMNGDQEKPLQNGNSEKESVADSEENNLGNVENGFVNDEGEENEKQNRRSNRQKIIVEKKSTPKKTKKDIRTSNESTPVSDTPTKRELRRREPTPRESTPKQESPAKRLLKGRGTPLKSRSVTPLKNVKLDVEEEKMSPDSGIQSSLKVEQNLEESVVIVEERQNGENLAVNIDDSDVQIVEQPKESFFSIFRRASQSPKDIKDIAEANNSTASIICLGTPAASEEDYEPPRNISGRRPINCFSRFPGRASVTSLDSPLKRKADDSFNDSVERKRFAGATESGSEKSPGWHFFSSPFGRGWSPAAKPKSPLIPSSTPFTNKAATQDSMIVNYDENTKMTLDETTQDHIKQEQPTKSQAGKWCTVM